jgi:hypothetical protein
LWSSVSSALARQSIPDGRPSNVLRCIGPFFKILYEFLRGLHGAEPPAARDFTYRLAP